MKPIKVNVGERSVSVQRDTNGVPHIDAESWHDALFGLGMMHAIDRGTQLLFARCIASGCASERISASAELIETDQFFRRMGLHLDLKAEVAELDPTLQEQLRAYAEGVNHGLSQTPRSLPMWATGFRPEPWDPESVMLIGKLLSFGGLAIGQMQNERLLIELIHAGVHEGALQELFGERLNDVDFDSIRRIHLANRLSDDALELMTDLPRLAGSNAWAVGPQCSESGHALLASDPHLEVNRLPAIWYEAVLTFGEAKYILGATLPGCPLFAVARTAELAWGVTYMKGDTVDYFIEDCQQIEGRWHFRRGQQWVPFEVREEVLKPKGQEPRSLQVYRSPQGILESDPAEAGEGYHLAVNWSGSYPGNGRAIGTWLEVAACQSVKQALEVARQCPQPTLCWVFADRDDHIGQTTCGRFPIRGNGHLGLAPIPAWDPQNHWQGFLDSEELPMWYDPPEGYVATANEEIHVEGLPMLITQTLPDYRKRRICQRLEGFGKATLEDMQSLQYDVVSLQARDLLREWLPCLEEGELKQRLSDWDGSYSPDSQEAQLFLQWYRSTMMEVLGHDQGIGWRRMVYLSSRAGYSSMLLTAADRLLLRSESVWWSGRNKSELIRQAAERVELQPATTWSQVNNFHFTDRFFGNHQVGRLLGFNTRKYAMPGNHSTPFQGHVMQTARRESTFAPSYHFVTDIAQDEAWTNLPGGASENRFSRYYKNDIGRWAAGEYKRLAPVLLEQEWSTDTTLLVEQDPTQADVGPDSAASPLDDQQP